MRHSLPLLLLALVTLACAPRREATVPFSPPDALTRAVRILESFEYNVVEIDRDRGLVRGIRTAEHLSTSVVLGGSRGPTPPGDVLWEVSVHVTPSGDEGAHYRLESRVATDAYHLDYIDPAHLDRILVALADWKR